MAASTRTSSTSSSTTTRRFWRRTGVAAPWWPRGLMPLLGLLALYLFGVFITAPAMEADVRRGVYDTLKTAGASVDEISASGQGVTARLHAGAPDEALLEALAETTRCDTWAGELECPTWVDLDRTAAEPTVIAEATAVEPIAEPGPDAALARAEAVRRSCNAALNDTLAGTQIQFRTASADIDSASAAVLQRLADVANACPGSLTIEGHTDSQGDADMNQALSQARANAVRDALAGLGVDAIRMNAVGYGELRPIADNTTADGRATNRRIAISVDDTE